jgi:hypothetical protein
LRFAPPFPPPPTCDAISWRENAIHQKGGRRGREKREGGVAGSATGKEAMARLKANDDEKKAATVVAAAKNDDK